MAAFAAPAALLILLSSATAQPIAQAHAFDIDARRSEAVFTVQLRARQSGVEGRLAAPRGELSGSVQGGWTVQVKVDGRRLRVDGPRWMERMTRSASFLAVDRHPWIRFASAPFGDRLLHAGGELPGQLTLRGLTRPVSLRLLPSQCARPGQDCDIHVQGELSRKDFGMTAYRAFLRDGVDVHFRVRLRPESAP